MGSHKTKGAAREMLAIIYFIIIPDIEANDAKRVITGVI